MPDLIDNDKFQLAHAAFLQRMLAKTGIPFTNFDHKFLGDDELEYKLRAVTNASKVLELKKWPQGRKETGHILKAVIQACLRAENLLVPGGQFGEKGCFYSPLYNVKSQGEIKELERELFTLLRGGPSTPSHFAPRFDRFADFLRQRKLGCKWDFMAYLAFMLDHRLYFPIKPSEFERLLRFYDMEIRLVNNVAWIQYARVLDVAQELRQRLANYGWARPIEIQSYMWVVARLLRKPPPKPPPTEPDFDAELAGRRNRALERERIGLLGERFVYATERQRLTEAGIARANDVELVSSTGSDSGYDVRSFVDESTELHIEVKTTTRSPGPDDAFWLTDSG